MGETPVPHKVSQHHAKMFDPRPQYFTTMLNSLLFIPLLLHLSADESPGKPPLEFGKHPRLLFDARHLSSIRLRAKTDWGEALLHGVRHKGHGAYDFIIKALAKRDQDWFAKKRKEAPNILSRFAQECWSASLYAVSTGDSRDALIAVELFRIWLSGYPPNEEIKAQQSWGNPWLAMSYDWIHEYLTDAERARSQVIFGSMVGKATMDMIGSEWWCGGPTPAMRYVTNWTPIWASSLLITNLAIEGEQGYNPELTPHCIRFLRGYLDGGIAPDGAIYEGVGYAGGYGTKDVGFALMALQRRGIDLITTTNLRHVPHWLAYEILPWGWEALPLNQSMGRLGSNSFSTLIAARYGGLAKWMFHNITGRTLEKLAAEPATALINSLPQYRGERPDKLLLSHWFSTAGQVICRSGWGERDAHFAFNTNPVGSGHSHADQGSFCLSSNGAAFITEGGVTHFASQYHNIVMIDGRGQAQVQGGTDSFIHSVDSNSYADIIDADTKLAYDRRLQGGTGGPWTWLEYNPVKKSRRRCMFVRGASGPLLIVADEIQKDDKEHTYEWLAHVPENNAVTVNGRQFHIRERFGGKYLQTLERGKKTTFVAKDARAGTLRGWALIRSVPHLYSWSSNDLDVNGVKCPYNTAYFGLGEYRYGWQWLPILPNRKAEIEHKGGPLRFGMSSATGGRIALAVFTYKKDWEPGDELPKNGGDFIVLGVESAEHSDNPWDVHEIKKGELHGVMLGKTPPKLSIKPSPKSLTKVIYATQKTTRGNFLAVMVPGDEGIRKMEMSKWGQGEVVTISNGVDQFDCVISALDSETNRGLLQTDAQAAVVSLKSLEGRANVRFAYAMMNGTQLIDKSGLEVEGSDGQFVRATGGRVHVLNDRKLLVVRGPGGANVRCYRMGATSALVNGRKLFLPKEIFVTIKIPKLPERWDIKISKDGFQVDVTGKGPQPLSIAAPKAKNVTVNGVNRWFVRDGKGNIFPALEYGSPFRYENQLEAVDLKDSLSRESGATFSDLKAIDPNGESKPVILSKSGKIGLNLPVPGPGLYKLVVRVMAKEKTSLQVQALGGTKSSQVSESAELMEHVLTIENIGLAKRQASMSLQSGGPIALLSIRLNPEYRRLSANLWSTIGPFPSNYIKDRGHDTADVKEALETVYPPDQKVDLSATYKGDGGEQVMWLQSARTEGPVMKDGVNFKIRNGVKKSKICYAVTFIDSPDDRTVEMRVSCDYWANLFLNGKRIKSQRTPAGFRKDGAWFNGVTRIKSIIELKKGRNTLLAKVQGGMGGSSFTCLITDPGDLKITPK